MCGEIFSSKIPDAIKARVDQPHPLARPGRWSVVFSAEGVKGVKGSLRRSYIDRDPSRQQDGEGGGLGFSTEALALEEVRRESGGRNHFVIPPAENYGDHDAARLNHAQLVALGNAILNNNKAGYEVLRQEYADLTRAPKAPAQPAQPTRQELVLSRFPTKAAAAEAIVAFLTDSNGDAGNSGSYIDLDAEPGGYGVGQYEFKVDNDTLAVDSLVGPADVSDGSDHYGSVDYLRDLVRAYQNADD